MSSNPLGGGAIKTVGQERGIYSAGSIKTTHAAEISSPVRQWTLLRNKFRAPGGGRVVQNRLSDSFNRTQPPPPPQAGGYFVIGPASSFLGRNSIPGYNLSCSKLV